MLFSSTLILQQTVLICSILLAIGLGFGYLHQRGHLQSLRPACVPLIGFAVFGICDALVTLHGTWQAPWREANPSMRAFLIWCGWWGQCLGSVLWIFAWVLVLDGLESWRSRASKRTAERISWLRLWIVYALALGHLNGFVSWVDRSGPVATLFSLFYRFWSRNIGWIGPLSPFGYPLYSGLFFGGACALAHAIIVRLYQRRQVNTLPSS
jgi:hypothetical protein